MPTATAHTSCFAYESMCIIIVPGKPTVLAKSTATSILLSWSVPTGSVVDSYEVVWEREDRDQQSSVVTGPESNNYTIVDLESGVECVITVTAVNGAGQSSSSVKVATGVCVCV